VLAGKKTRIIDLGGRVMLPGFVDAHSHTDGVSPDSLDLTEASSIADITEAVRKKVATTPPGQWIVGAGPFMFWQGWDERRLRERRLVTRWDLDPVSPNHPVLLIKDAGHALVLNSYAMKMGNITKDTPDPRKEIVKDPTSGEPTGVLLEASMSLGINLLPEASLEDRVKAERNASNQLLGFGITTVAAMSVSAPEIAAFQYLYANTKEPLVSTILCPYVPTTRPLQEVLQFVNSWQVITGFGDQRLKLGSLKIFLDGGITGRAAWFKKPYKNRPDFYGIPQVERETLFAVVRQADKLGWQIHFHACGDAAAELALQALEAAQKENHTQGRRHILTHLYILSPDMIARMNRLGVVAVLQPNFVYSLGEHMREALSDDQLSEIVPVRRLLRGNVPVALGIDGLPENPMYAIYAAVVRRTNAGNVLAANESVSVMEAVRAYTNTSAYALFEEQRRGSIEPAKIADLIVLDQDIFKVPPETIKDVKVVLTVKAGQIAVDRFLGKK
jgi:predicted amidohydrolase YtcJ